MRLHGQDAIDHATATGGTVNAYADPISDAVTGLDPRGEDVAERMAADEGLIWVEVDPEREAYRLMADDHAPGGHFTAACRLDRIRKMVLRCLPWATYEQATEYALQRCCWGSDG